MKLSMGFDLKIISNVVGGQFFPFLSVPTSKKLSEISGEHFPAARFQKELEVSPRVVLALTPTVLSSQETIEKL